MHTLKRAIPVPIIIIIIKSATTTKVTNGSSINCDQPLNCTKQRLPLEKVIIINNRIFLRSLTHFTTQSSTTSHQSKRDTSILHWLGRSEVSPAPSITCTILSNALYHSLTHSNLIGLWWVVCETWITSLAAPRLHREHTQLNYKVEKK